MKILCLNCNRPFDGEEERYFDEIKRVWIDVIPKYCSDCKDDLGIEDETTEEDEDGYPVDSKFKDVLDEDE